MNSMNDLRANGAKNGLFPPFEMVRSFYQATIVVEMQWTSGHLQKSFSRIRVSDFGGSLVLQALLLQHSTHISVLQP